VKLKVFDKVTDPDMHNMTLNPKKRRHKILSNVIPSTLYFSALPNLQL
jgi:hypothetical protein